MNLGLLLPVGLAALGALLLPLLIHLARRSEQRPTSFAALQWLRARSKPRHRLRFDEWPLLLVRVLLLVLLALLLARPVSFGSSDHQPRVVVVPGVDLPQARAANVAADARWLWLTPGFPAFDATTDAPAGTSSVPSASTASKAPLVTTGSTDATASISSLLRELDASLAPEVALTVLVPERLDGVDAARPILSRHVDWRVLPGATTSARVAAKDIAPSASVRYAPQREASVRYLRAAAAAWHASTAAYTPDVAPLSQPFDTRSRHLAWLAPGPLPQSVADWVRNGGVALVDAETSLTDAPAMVALWRDDTGAVLVEGGAYGRGRLLRLTRALVPQEFPQLLDPGFPEHLRQLFAPSRSAPASVRAVDLEPATGGPAFMQAPRELQPWLIALIALAFSFERWLATATRQRVAP